MMVHIRVHVYLNLGIGSANAGGEMKMNGDAFKCRCFINMQEFWHACRVFKYLHEYLGGNAGNPNCKIFNCIFVASDATSEEEDGNKNQP